MKRLFIAINLSEEIRSGLTRIITRINADFRWIPPENWHLTLVFLGSQPDEAIIPILEAIKQTAQNFPEPEIEFEKIIFAPPGREPRMIWLLGSKQTSQILGEIKNNLENNLIENGVRFKIENRQFHSHLTLARFNFGMSDTPANITVVGQPSIKKLSFTTESLDLMESILKPSGAEYEILTRVDFNE